MEITLGGMSVVSMVKLIDIVACMEEVKGMIQHVHRLYFPPVIDA